MQLCWEVRQHALFWKSYVASGKPRAHLGKVSETSHSNVGRSSLKKVCWHFRSAVIIVAIALVLLDVAGVKLLFCLHFFPRDLEDDPLLLQLSWAFTESVEVKVCVLILSLTQSSSLPPPTSPTHCFLFFFLILNNLGEG